MIMEQRQLSQWSEEKELLGDIQRSSNEPWYAEPRTFVAALALNVLGSTICPAPSGWEGTMLMNSFTPGHVNMAAWEWSDEQLCCKSCQSLQRQSALGAASLAQTSRHRRQRQQFAKQVVESRNKSCTLACNNFHGGICECA